jgi:type IV pilus assembly protein PilA
MKKMNNKGFSLVELIVVIAIMAVLVGVLAPQFIKYVESSRRSTDVSNAETIRSAVLADIAEGLISGSSASSTCQASSPSTLGEGPKAKGNKVGVGSDFSISYNAPAGTCEVSLGSYNLSTTSGVSLYKVP